jgi:hypothetical protein
MTCETSITPEIYAKLPTCEYVVARTYTHKDGKQTAKIIDAGTLSEMAELAGRNCLLIVPDYLESISDCVVPVAELIPPT